MINETALICDRFLSPLCKAVKMHVILFFNKTRTREGEGRRGEGRGGEGRGGEGKEGGRCVCVGVVQKNKKEVKRWEAYVSVTCTWLPECLYMLGLPIAICKDSLVTYSVCTCV